MSGGPEGDRGRKRGATEALKPTHGNSQAVACAYYNNYYISVVPVVSGSLFSLISVNVRVSVPVPSMTAVPGEFICRLGERRWIHRSVESGVPTITVHGKQPNQGSLVSKCNCFEDTIL